LSAAAPSRRTPGVRPVGASRGWRLAPPRVRHRACGAAAPPPATGSRPMPRRRSRHDPRAHSRLVFDGVKQTPSRAMLHAVGFTREDFTPSRRSAICSTWSQVTPCNLHIDELARHAAAGANGAGGKATIFNTITVSDGISMGTEGMKYSLVSREVIADSIETVIGAEGLRRLRRHRRVRQEHARVCDGDGAPQPAVRVRLRRHHLPGRWRDRPVDIVSVFEAVGSMRPGRSPTPIWPIERTPAPGAGSCGGMYTANTMASAIEALGLSLPNSSAQAAVSAEKREDCRARRRRGGRRCSRRGIRPRDILTRKAFENAITAVIALGGSTNAVLHLLAMAHAAACADDRRLHAHRPARAGAGRSEAERPLRDGGAGAHRRSDAAAEDAARARDCSTARP
jgi:dihydroxy-acid dehydratase